MTIKTFQMDVKTKISILSTYLGEWLGENFTKYVSNLRTSEPRLDLTTTTSTTFCFIIFRKDVYTLSSKPLGYVKFVKLRHDGKSNNPIQWHLNKVFVFVHSYTCIFHGFRLRVRTSDHFLWNIFSN